MNQWCFRSSIGRQCSLEFWYNAGSLDGNALLEQFNQIVLQCKTVGMRIIGFVCDAGGNNTKLFRFLHEKNVITEGGWLPISKVQTRNPFQPLDRYINIFHCSTHDLKNIRNSLYKSWQKGGARELLDTNGVKIGRGIIEKCFWRDRQREIDNLAPILEVKEVAVILNKLSIMNISLTKCITSQTSLAGMTSNLYTELGYDKKDIFPKIGTGITHIGYRPSVAKHLQSVLPLNPSKIDVLGPDISSFEWLTNVHQIFNVTLLKIWT